MKIIHVVGARPNFVKVAPLMSEMARYPMEFAQTLVHTGQHYDDNMSGVFFRNLELPRPDVYLGVGSGSHAEQTAKVMLSFERVVMDWQPEWVVVVGDVNSTLATALVCTKLGVRLAHVEAGLRSFDRSMPEEMNRLLTDQMADLLFTTEESANANLRREGIAPAKIHFVGNIMIDSLVKFLPMARDSHVLDELGLSPRTYAVATLHRPANVDNRQALMEILHAFNELAPELPVIFPLHPRTRERLRSLKEGELHPDIRLIPPQGYLDFMQLYSNARLVLTDSGGLQEETTYLGIPCLTIRPNTERPVTLRDGTNQLVATSCEAILAAARKVLDSGHRQWRVPQFWDGRTAARIAAVLRDSHTRDNPLAVPEESAAERTGNLCAAS